MAVQPLPSDGETRQTIPLRTFSLEQGESDDPLRSSSHYSDDDLPVIGSRNGNWWYSTFHNVTAMVGAGVLTLPYSMVYLGWGAGIAALVASWIITLYTLWQMVEMHESESGERYDRYHELGQKALGKRLGLVIVIPLNIIVEAGTDIVYMVTGGQCLYTFYRLVKCKHQDLCRTSIGEIPFIIIFSSQHFFLAQLPNFNSIAGLSLAASVMSLSYSTIAWADSAHVGRHDPVDYHLPDKGRASLVFGAFEALGTVAFAYAGHNVVLEIQSTLPSTDRVPSKIPMWRGVVMAYVTVAICYFPVALLGYWAFGNTVSPNILATLHRPRWLIAVANLMVVVHVTGSYQLYAIPVFDMMETLLTLKFNYRRTSLLKIVTRSLYVFFTAFVACALPFFSDLMGFFGGLVLAPTTYYLPCIIWLCIKRPRRWSLSWTINWILIVLGILLSVVATVGSFRNIVVKVQSKQYHWFKTNLNLTDVER